jgi:hypothetical protein
MAANSYVECLHLDRKVRNVGVVLSAFARRSRAAGSEGLVRGGEHTGRGECCSPVAGDGAQHAAHQVYLRPLCCIQE